MKRRNILMVGGEKGSWEMRGHQLGGAIGARCTVKPSMSDWDWADVVVLVKRAGFLFASSVRHACCPIVWDVLDWWEQPAANRKSPSQLLEDVTRCRRILGDVTMIGATRAMASDIGGVYLPHHSRIGLTANPVRPKARIVAYEGRVKYLGRWTAALEQACARFGLTFVINPQDLSEADIVVALRDGAWDGLACRRWKSGVKYSNAIAAGRPVITQACEAWVEMAPSGRAIEHESELDDALQALLPLSVRQSAFERHRTMACQYRLETIAAQYRAILQSSMVMTRSA